MAQMPVVDILTDVHDLTVQVQKVLDAGYSIRSVLNDHSGQFEVTLTPRQSLRNTAVGQGLSFLKAWTEAYDSLPIWAV